MLPGGPLLARLAWRPQLQLRRVLVQCATLPAQRSESSDQRRGQGQRFAPLIGATGALIGAAIVSDEERRQLPHHHRQVEIPLNSLHQMQDPRRVGTQQLPAIIYLYK